MRNEETIRRFIQQIFNEGNLSALEHLVHPNYTYTSPTETMKSPQELAAFIIAFRAAFPDVQITVTDQVSRGASVSTRIRFTGTHQGEFLGMPATGRTVDVEGCILSQFEDGLIAQEWELLDHLTLLQQLGAVA